MIRSSIPNVDNIVGIISEIADCPLLAVIVWIHWLQTRLSATRIDLLWDKGNTKGETRAGCFITENIARRVDLGRHNLPELPFVR